MSSKLNRSLTAFLVVSLLALLSGFGSLAAPSTPNYKTLDLRMVTGSSGSALYTLSAQYTEAFKSTYPGSRASVAVGGGVSNIVTISEGEYDIGSTAVPALFAAMNGEAPFEKKYDGVRAVWRSDPIQGVAMVTVKSGIISLNQVKSNKMRIRLAVMPVGNYTELFAKQLLACYGMTYQDIISWGGSVQYTSHGEASDLFKDGHLDMYITMINKGHAYTTEIFNSQPMKFLPLEPKDIEPLMTKGYGKGFVETGWFKGVTEDVPAAISSNLFISHKDVSEELIYFAVKLYYEKYDDFATTIAALKQTIKETEIFDCFGAKLHPGAEKYYKEIGILK